MNKSKETFRDAALRLEFEYRIFVSFGIVIAVALIALGPFNYLRSPVEGLLSLLGISSSWTENLKYFAPAIFMVAASALRIWAGSTLSSHRMMSFRVQTDTLLTEPPYTLCRNPIYLADFTAFCGFALILPAVAVSLPVLLLLHYTRLIRYEEAELRWKFGAEYSTYEKHSPPFFPNLKSIRATILSGRGMRFNGDGFRHNALYLLFIPGFIVAAFTHNFYHALAIGLPAVFDWAIIHTVIGTSDRRPTTNSGD